MVLCCEMKLLDYLLSEIGFSVASMDRFTASRDNVWSRTLGEAKTLFAEQHEGDSEAIAESGKSISALLDLGSSTKHGQKARSSFRYFGQEKVRSVITHAYEGKLPFKWTCNWSSTTIQEKVLKLNVIFGPLLLKRRSRLVVPLPWMFIGIVMDAICYKGASKGSRWLDHKNLQKLFGKAKSAMEKGVQHRLSDEMKSRLQGCLEVLANFMSSIMGIYPEIDLLDMKAIVDDFEYHFKMRQSGKVRHLPPRPLFEKSSRVMAMIDMIRRVDPLLSVEFMLFSVPQERYLAQLISMGKLSLEENEIGDMSRLRDSRSSLRPQERAEENAATTENQPSEEGQQSRQNPTLEPEQHGRKNRNPQVGNAIALGINIDHFLLDGLSLFSDISQATSLIRSPSNETVIGDIMNVLFEPWVDTKKVNFKKLFMLSLAFMEGINDEAVDCSVLTEGIVSSIGNDGKFIEKFARGYKNRKIGAGLEKRAPGKQVFVKLQESSSLEGVPFLEQERPSGDIERQSRTQGEIADTTNRASAPKASAVRPFNSGIAVPVGGNPTSEKASWKRHARGHRADENRRKRLRSGSHDGPVPVVRQISRLEPEEDMFSLDAVPKSGESRGSSERGEDEDAYAQDEDSRERGTGGQSAANIEKSAAEENDQSAIVPQSPHEAEIRSSGPLAPGFQRDGTLEHEGTGEDTMRKGNMGDRELSSRRAGGSTSDRSRGSKSHESRRGEGSDGKCSLDELLDLTQFSDAPDMTFDPIPEPAVTAIVEELRDTRGDGVADVAEKCGSGNCHGHSSGNTGYSEAIYSYSQEEEK